MIYAWCDVPYLGTSWDAPSYAGCITSCGPIPLRPRNNMALTDSMRHAPFFLLTKTLGHHNNKQDFEKETQKCKRPQRNKGLQRIQWVFLWFSLLLKKNTFDTRTTWNNAPMKSRVQYLEFMKVLEIPRPYCLDGISLRLFVHEMDWPWSCEAINPRNMALVLI